MKTKAQSEKEYWDVMRTNQYEHITAITETRTAIYGGVPNVNWGRQITVAEPWALRWHMAELKMPTAKHASDAAESYWRAGFGTLDHAEAQLDYERRVIADAQAAIDQDPLLTSVRLEASIAEVRTIADGIDREVSGLATQIRTGDISETTKAAFQRKKGELGQIRKTVLELEDKARRRRAHEQAAARTIDPRLIAWVDALTSLERVLDREEAWHQQAEKTGHWRPKLVTR